MTTLQVVLFVAACLVGGWALEDIIETLCSPEFRRDLERLREQRRARKIARKG